jgi:hypothetical protein
MTVLTTALGLAPLLYATGVGSEVQRPLAAVVVDEHERLDRDAAIGVSFGTAAV